MKELLRFSRANSFYGTFLAGSVASISLWKEVVTHDRRLC